MSDLTEFLLARIAEDEAVARAIMAEGYSEGRWQWDMHRNAPYRSALVDEHDRVVLPPKDDDVFPSRNVAEHIARHDPARVLAECEAKRRIIAFHESWPVLIQTEPSLELTPETWVAKMTSDIAWLTNAEYVKRFGTDPPTAPMLLAMAQVYADHTDYREEWRS